MCLLIPFMNELFKLQTKLVFRFKIDNAQSFTLENAEPLFHLIHPGAMHGCEVKDKARMLGHPLEHLAAMMCTDIVTSEMNRLDGLLNLPVQLFQKGDAFLLSFAVITRPIDLTRPSIKGGNQIQDSSTLIFMLKAVGPVVGLGWQGRRWASPRRQRGLLVHRQHPLILAQWTSVERDQLGDRGLERGVSGLVGMEPQMMAPGLQLMGRQKPPHR
jgi:hypothetical protein